LTRGIDGKELNLMISVIKKYYELGMTQEQIAREEFISKSSVCRLIKKAVEHNYVSYRINYPVESVRALEDEFRGRFSLDKVFITPSYSDSKDVNLKDTLKTAAEDVCKMIRAGDALSITWGNTMDLFASALENVGGNRKCAKVVLMCGSLAGDIISLKSSQNVERLAKFFSAEGYILPAPLILDTKESADLIRGDSHIRYIMDIIRDSRISVMSLGGVSPQTVLMQRNAYTKAEYENFMELGAVGDIAGRYFNITGEKVSESIDERTMGIDLDELKKKEIRVGIAVGVHKVQAILGALRGEYINMLYMDEHTAKAVIELMDGS
jgi:deoxyribonucleoside regulator